MSDPYEILGVSPNATEEQIKAAYRSLAKKYHPDHYQDTPLADLASEKMKEVNEAYDVVMKQRKSGTQSTGYNSYQTNNSNPYQDGYYSGGNASYDDVRRLIMQGRLDEAERLLDKVSNGVNTAEGYFLRGSIQYRRGMLEQAMYNIQRACRLDPDNLEYLSMYDRMSAERNGQYAGYNRSTNTYGGNHSSCNACDVCSCLICSDCCCECMGGDLISCC
ncbi:MAG: J domain-containing protein [Clostridia bacterium]|nr:J domain-containing protein [Clostridia bacterium]